MPAHPASAPIAPAAPVPPLVPARRAASLVVGLAVVAFAALALWVHDTRIPKGIDDSVDGWLFEHTGSFVQQTTLAFTEPALTIGTCAVVAVIALLSRRRDIAGLAVVGPVVGLVLESYVFKPWINRIFGYEAEIATRGAVKAGYGFPSGHETGVTSAAMLLLVLALRTGWSQRAKAASIAGAALWMAVGSIGLVRSMYHYFTDTVGAVLLGIAVMLTTAMLIDRFGGRLSSPAGRGRSRTAREA